jgi:LPS export ABC transporter protein LptC/lipopolysaccharide transport protein LptA
MKVKKILSIIVVSLLIASIAYIYLYFYNTKRVQIKEETIKIENPNKRNLHIIKDFAYSHYKKNKIVFTLKAKEHFLAEDQRSEFNKVEVEIYNPKGEKEYLITAEEGILPKDKDFVLLRNKVLIKSSKGWEVKTHAIKYDTNEEKLEFPHNCDIKWKEEELTGRANSINYFSKARYLELIGNVILSQIKNELIKIKADYIMINEGENSILIKGEPAKVFHDNGVIRAAEFFITRDAGSKSFKSLTATSDVVFLYRSREEFSKGKLNNIKAMGNHLEANFDNYNHINSWRLSEDAAIRAVFYGDDQKVSDMVCAIRAPTIKGNYENGILKELEAGEKIIFKFIKHPINLNNSVFGYAKQIKIKISEQLDNALNEVILNDESELVFGDNKGKASRIEYDFKNERATLIGNASWKTPELLIKAYKIYFDNIKNELNASENADKLVQTTIVSHKKKIFQKNDKKPINLLSENVDVKGGTAKFSKKVILSSSKYVMHADEIMFDFDKEEMAANKIDNFQIVSDNNEDYYLKADKMNYSNEKSLFNFTGDIYFKNISEGAVIKADKLKLNVDENGIIKNIIAEGNVSISKGSVNGECKKAFYNINSEEIKMEGSSNVSKDGKNKIQGEQLVLDVRNETIVAYGDKYKRVEGLYYENIEEGNKKK